MKLVIRGAVAGLAGTTVMSGAMFLANKTGMTPGGPPPRDITENLERKLGVRDRLPEPAFEASWAMLHFAYGTASGVPCALTQKVLDRDQPIHHRLDYLSVRWDWSS